MSSLLSTSCYIVNLLHNAFTNLCFCVIKFLSSQFLVKRDADLFAENEIKETPCDCAEKQHHKELALSLESQMVFSTDPNAEDIEAEYAALDRREVSSLSNILTL